MALTVNLLPGHLFVEGEELCTSKLNAAANPTVDVAGGVDPSTLADGSVTTAKLATEAFSADTTGQSKMADGFLLTAELADNLISADTLGGFKLPDLAVATAKLANGAFSADAPGRAKVVSNFVLPAVVSTAGTVTTTPSPGSIAVKLDWSTGTVFNAGPWSQSSIHMQFFNAKDGQVIEFVWLESSGPTVSWPAGLLWKGGTAPPLPVAGTVTTIVWVAYLGGVLYGWWKQQF